MPRFDKKRYPKKASEFSNSAREERTFDDESKIESSVGRVRDFLTRLFGNDTNQTAKIYKSLILRLEPIWDREIAPSLIQEFGRNTPLYGILYQGEYRNEVVMEIWDPRHVETKSSQVFTIRGIPESETRYFPKSRNTAEIFNINDWI
ncbi:MAG: hypothetical protein SAJ37_17180 [Oscillatoria sp. PMC 1068.18]|nr:hypothetical protein [Oscillatoria sp. PMC 1076.18]MEC4990466.1 hypothetical protein [Oscillatoria sp. PMC 1068.18]